MTAKVLCSSSGASKNGNMAAPISEYTTTNTQRPGVENKIRNVKCIHRFVWIAFTDSSLSTTISPSLFSICDISTPISSVLLHSSLCLPACLTHNYYHFTVLFFSFAVALVLRTGRDNFCFEINTLYQFNLTLNAISISSIKKHCSCLFIFQFLCKHSVFFCFHHTNHHCFFMHI